VDMSRSCTDWKLDCNSNLQKQITLSPLTRQLTPLWYCRETLLMDPYNGAKRCIQQVNVYSSNSSLSFIIPSSVIRFFIVSVAIHNLTSHFSGMNHEWINRYNIPFLQDLNLNRQDLHSKPQDFDASLRLIAFIAFF
jgi:hypothetical protein